MYSFSTAHMVNDDIVVVAQNIADMVNIISHIRLYRQIEWIITAETSQ